MRYEIRPLGDWPNKTPHGKPNPFRAKWSGTLGLLARETAHLGAQLVVIQVDAKESEIRNDGMLYARAKVGYRGVRISFESKHGPLTYATDVYESRYYDDEPSWQQNVRAIALALESLRAVDRHGVSKSGEQYRGWAAIEARPATLFASMDAAAQYIAEHSGEEHVNGGDIMDDPTTVDRAMLKRLYRSAALRLHPDHGGDATQFDRLNAAYRMLGGGQ